jgi:ketosteroid isomerase-like protein
MTDRKRSAELLAVGWIEAWIRMDMEWLRERLAPDFVHTSPFGRLTGRDSYLETVEPMARKSVQELEVKDVVATGNQAAVWFENRTPNGVIPSCDWVRIEDGLIKEIQSFYDSAKVREALSTDEQESLGGSYQ